MKKLLGVVLYFFVLHKQLDAKNGNLRTSDAKNEQVEKRKKFTNGWVPYYLPPKGQTAPIALLAALPEKTIFRKSGNMRKDMKEEEEGEENVNNLIQSGEENDADFQFKLQIVEGADHSTDDELEEGSSPADAVHMEVPTGEMDNLEEEALLEQVAAHTAEHAAELVAELVEEEPLAALVDEEQQAADDQNGEAPEEIQPLPVQEVDEVSVEETEEGTPSVAEQAVDESVPNEPEDAAVPSETEDAAVPEPNENNGSEVDTEEEASGKENFYHLEEDEEEEEEFEDDYDYVMHKINEHEGETPSNDGSKNLNRADIITMLAVRNMLSALNYDYAVMDFLTGFNPDVISSIYLF